MSDTGKISSSLPGGWVMVSGLKDFQLDVVMKSSQLELIPDRPIKQQGAVSKKPPQNSRQSESSTDSVKTNVNLIDTLNDIIDEHLR